MRSYNSSLMVQKVDNIYVPTAPLKVDSIYQPNRQRSQISDDFNATLCRSLHEELQYSSHTNILIPADRTLHEELNTPLIQKRLTTLINLNVKYFRITDHR